MHTILKTCLVNLAWILFFLFVVTSSAQARNEYLNDGTNTCDQGSWKPIQKLDNTNTNQDLAQNHRTKH